MVRRGQAGRRAGGRRFAAVSALTLAATVLYGRAFAYRPFATEDAGVVGKGVLELEASLDHARWRGGDRDVALLLVPVYGVTQRLELSVDVPYMFHDPEEGGQDSALGDITVSAKIALAGETARRPALTLKGFVKSDSGDHARGSGSGHWDYHLGAAASKTLGDLTLHGALGHTFIGASGHDGARDIYLYGLAADWRLTATLHLVTEATGSKNRDRRVKADPLSFLVGLTYRLFDGLTLDAGLRYGANRSVPELGVTAGATVTF